MNEEIIIHENQSEIYDFLKIDNKNCLNCTENIKNVCNSITSEFYNIAINDIDLSFCINQDKKHEDGGHITKEQMERLFDII